MFFYKYMELQVGVKVLLKNKEDKYLLLRRSPIKYPNASGYWTIVGGRINPGTTLLINLKREIKEETNLDLIVIPRLIAAQDILRMEGKHVVRLTYIGEIEGEVELDEENTEFKWLTIEEMRNLNDLDEYFKELLDNGKIG